MCEEKSISDEHVPPKCIFPEVKDLGIDYRKSPIKVPSCDVHNMRKSKEDEYLMMVLTCSITNNRVAMNQIQTKILRSWERNPKLAGLLLRVNKPIKSNGQSTLAFKVDVNRFNRSLDWIVRGLYFSQHKKKWVAELRIESPAMLFLEGSDAMLTVSRGYSNILTRNYKSGDDLNDMFPVIMEVCDKKSKKDYSDCSLVIVISFFPPFKEEEPAYIKLIQKLEKKIIEINFIVKKIYLLVIPLNKIVKIYG